MEGFYIAALQRVPGLGVAGIRSLLEKFPSAEYAWNAASDELAEVKGISPSLQSALVSFRAKEKSLPEQLAETCRKKQISICIQKDSVYPALLREINHPPLVLFYRGKLEADGACLAMVGSRRATAYGKGTAETLAREIAGAGVTIISGAALGIDTASHKGALQSGRTVAVLGCGVDVAYPSSNRRLLDEIAENGAVVSEYGPGTRPVAAFFPARNRIISGISLGTLVVEAAERSGSLITAEMALSEGRDVFAVPGSIFSEQSRGTNRLIQQGAKLVQCAQDVLSEYMEKPQTEAVKQSASDSKAELTAEEREIYNLLSFEQPQSVDEIIYRLNGSNVSNIAFLLLQMELKGIVIEDSDHNYLRH